MRMGRLVVMAAALAGAGLGGCANQSSYDRLSDANRSLTERNQDLERGLNEANLELSRMRQHAGAGDTAVGDLRAANARLRTELDASQRALADLENRLNSVAIGPLDQATDRALQQLAAQYPELVQYDAARGMLRFASDLTFDSGSDTVKESAKTSLQALGRILTSGAAAQYELFIVGHTDSQPISAGTAQRHATNMHLSCHRAIAVRSALAGIGVPAGKMYAAGWGEHRPAVPNTTTGNTPQNRRVEVFLTRPTGATAEPARTAPTREAPARQPDVNK